MMRLIECPRDAMQGIADFIPTEKKIAYINALLKVGFHTLDCGSFVSPKAIPQMQDTAEVLNGIDLVDTKTKLSVVVANERGAMDAATHEKVDIIGFPFSISETFQLRNTNSTIEESLKRVEKLKSICDKHQKSALVYISMAFGNPYGDEWNEDIAIKWVEKLHKAIGITQFSMADTIGISTSKSIQQIMEPLINEFSQLNFSAHLHSSPTTQTEKIEAVIKSGCEAIEGAILGFGGCPMAEDKLVGNMAMENIVDYCKVKKIETQIDQQALKEVILLASSVFPN